MKSTMKTPSKLPYYKLDKEYEPHSVPTFQSRRTLANHVRDNMLCSGRRSYFQRVIYVARHKSIIELHKIKEPFNKIIKELYKYPAADFLGGLLIGHENYSVHMLEGSDELIGKFFQHLSSVADELFETSRVVLVYNNINQRFLEKIIWRLANLETTTTSDFDPTASDEKNISTFLKKMYYLFKKIKEEEADEDTTFKSFYLTTDLEEWTPDESLMDAVLKVEELQTIQEFASIYGNFNSMLTFEEKLWPVSHDYVPSNAVGSGRYNVNLTFGKEFKQ